MPDRLRRLEFTFQRVPTYFVTACTNERRLLLNDAAVHARLIEFGKRGLDEGGLAGRICADA